MKKLVTVKAISRIELIPNVDQIEHAYVDDKTIIVNKNEFFEGQSVFYFQADSLIPLDNKISKYLSSQKIIEQEGKKYYHLQQDLILPYSLLTKLIPSENKRQEKEKEYQEDHYGDFSELFGVIKRK